MNKTAQLLIVFAAFCWGISGIWIRFLSTAGFSYYELTASRSVIVSACMFALLFITDRPAVKINIRDIWIFVCTGGFGTVLCTIFYIYTAMKITLSATTILLYTSPYMVLLISAVVFKERITLQKAGALLIAFTGCIMTTGLIGKTHLPAIGVLTGLGAAFSYSLYTIFSKFALKKYKPVTIIAYSHGISFILLAPFCDFGNIMTLVGSGEDLAALLLFAIVLSLLPALCYLKGLEKLEASRASILAFVEPLTAAAAGAVVYREMLSVIKVTGIALIFLALVVLNLKSALKQERMTV